MFFNMSYFALISAFLYHTQNFNLQADYSACQHIRKSLKKVTKIVGVLKLLNFNSERSEESLISCLFFNT